MRIAGRAVGMQIAVECQRRFWLLKIGYDEGVARCAPGNLLMLHTMKYAASRGLASYEFLGGATPWTAIWTKTLRLCTMVRAYPFSAAGMAALSVDGGLWAYERIKRKLQARKAQDGKPQNGTAPDAKPPDAKPQNGEKAD